MVGQGEAWVGLTDSDDVADGRREGLPVDMMPLMADFLWIPNTVAVISNAPHPVAAELLFEYLQRPEVVQRLVAANALEGVSNAGGQLPGLPVNWTNLLPGIETTTAKLNQIFLR